MTDSKIQQEIEKVLYGHGYPEKACISNLCGHLEELKSLIHQREKALAERVVGAAQAVCVKYCEEANQPTAPTGGFQAGKSYGSLNTRDAVIKAFGEENIEVK